MAAPITPQATPTRACERHDNGARSPDALGRRFSAGMRQFSNQHSDVRDMRRLNFPSISCARRSEEHTSELQSHHDLVCRLLLEQKKHREHTTTSAHSATGTSHN